MQSKEALWNRCLVKIEQQILPENYVTWFTPTYPHSLDNGAITIAVPNDFYKKCLTENYLDLIEFTLENISENVDIIQTIIDDQKEIECPEVLLGVDPGVRRPSYGFVHHLGPRAIGAHDKSGPIRRL
jgi:chromosomal replication initiation ATPase DnaA